MAKGKGSTSSNKKKATARGRAAEKSAHGGAGPMRASVKEMSQSRFPGERPLTGEDRPSNRRGGKAQGTSATPRGQRAGGGAKRGAATKRTPDTGRARPSPRGDHM